MLRRYFTTVVRLTLLRDEDPDRAMIRIMIRNAITAIAMMSHVLELRFSGPVVVVVDVLCEE